MTTRVILIGYERLSPDTKVLLDPALLKLVKPRFDLVRKTSFDAALGFIYESHTQRPDDTLCAAFFTAHAYDAEAVHAAARYPTVRVLVFAENTEKIPEGFVFTDEAHPYDTPGVPLVFPLKSGQALVALFERVQRPTEKE